MEHGVSRVLRNFVSVPKEFARSESRERWERTFFFPWITATRYLRFSALSQPGRYSSDGIQLAVGAWKVKIASEGHYCIVGVACRPTKVKQFLRPYANDIVRPLFPLFFTLHLAVLCSLCYARYRRHTCRSSCKLLPICRRPERLRLGKLRRRYGVCLKQCSGFPRVQKKFKLINLWSD